MLVNIRLFSILHAATGGGIFSCLAPRRHRDDPETARLRLSQSKITGVRCLGSAQSNGGRTVTCASGAT